MGIPQIILSGLILGSFISNFYAAGKEENVVKGWVVVIATAIEVGLLIWGGFYS